MRKKIGLFWLKLIAFLCVLAIAVNLIGTVLDGGQDILQSAAALRVIPRNSADVLWLGTSHMNYNVIPQYLYDLSGVTSVMVTGNSVDLKASYWELREAMLRQKPEVVVLDVYAAAAPYCYFYVQNVLAMEHREGMQPGSNPYNTSTGVARWLPVGSPYKIPAIWEAWQQSGADGYAYFQLTRLHDRIGSLTRSDLAHAAGSSRYIRNFGYRYSDTTLDAEDISIRPYTLEDAMAANEVGTYWEFTDEQLAQAHVMQESKDAIRRIADYLKKKDVQLVLCAAPYMINAAEEQLYEEIGEFAEELGVPYVGLYDSGVMGLEYVRDLGHLNDQGARLYTEFWSDYFGENFDLPDRRESTDRRYAPWRDHQGSHDMQHSAMNLKDLDEGLTGYLEAVSGLDADYLVMISAQGEVYEGFTEDDYILLTDEMGAACETLEDWYYTGTGTMDMLIRGDEMLEISYCEDGREHPLAWKTGSHDVLFDASGSRVSWTVDGKSAGKGSTGFNISVYSLLDGMMMDSRTFDMTQIDWDE